MKETVNFPAAVSFTCSMPGFAADRSGNPDLQVVHSLSGLIFQLAPRRGRAAEGDSLVMPKARKVTGDNTDQQTAEMSRVRRS
ncbi:MAG: hypothetical protein JWR69_3959 [Pedosphaera sp.]|nr:hypothetical protein [Pedosphaera sp.]